MRISRKYYRIMSVIERILLPRKWIHNDKIGINRLRRRLHLTESIIKKSVGRDKDFPLKYISEFRLDLIRSLMNVREYLLNRMFFLGCSDAEVEGFKRVNDTLYSLHQQMLERGAELWRRELSFDVKDDFDDDIDLEGKLFFSSNDESSLVRYDNDNFYGSDFPFMLELEDDLLSKGLHEIEFCHTSRKEDSTPEMTDKELGFENLLDDGNSWADSIVWFCDNPKIKDVFIHHPMNDLASNKNFPLPDIVRMNDFWCEIRVLHQKLSDQGGRHESYIINSGRN